MKKVSRFGIRAGTFNCSSDPRYILKGLSKSQEYLKAQLCSRGRACSVVKMAVTEGGFIHVFISIKVCSEFSITLFISILNTDPQLPKASCGTYMIRLCRA